MSVEIEVHIDPKAEKRARKKAFEKFAFAASYIDKAQPSNLVGYFEFFWSDILSARAIASIRPEKSKLRQKLLEQKRAVLTILRECEPEIFGPHFFAHYEEIPTNLAKELRNYLRLNPLVVDGQMLILAGHGRLEAAKLLGLREVPCIKAGHLTPPMARAYALADNKLAERSSWDEEILAEELKALSELPDLEIELTGFEQPEIDLRIQSADESDPDAADDFEAPSVPAISKLGDVWTLGKHRLFCGNSLDADSYAYLQGEHARQTHAHACA